MSSNLPPGCTSAEIDRRFGSQPIDPEADTYECADCGREFASGEERDKHFMSADCPERGASDNPDAEDAELTELRRWRVLLKNKMRGESRWER